ncbi:MAG TPA: hypothetical protein DDZ80_10865 [Cyanobacteria bacterium UBA8803]|nr:hypothetical protein [Cyanobacteria bacterium UBA9273]HBL58993.1 hypothetical protein [Cyanobacteria bacterium UBA8803]
MWSNSCPCCGNALLRHARRKGVYWFCTSCYQEMMPLNGVQSPSPFDTMNLESMLNSNRVRSRT